MKSSFIIIHSNTLATSQRLHYVNKNRQKEEEKLTVKHYKHGSGSGKETKQEENIKYTLDVFTWDLLCQPELLQFLWVSYSLGNPDSKSSLMNHDPYEIPHQAIREVCREFCQFHFLLFQQNRPHRHAKTKSEKIHLSTLYHRHVASMWCYIPRCINT